MEDIASAINNILNSKEGMEKLQEIANSIGLGGNMPPNNNLGTDNNSQEQNSMSSNSQNQQQAQQNNNNDMAQTIQGLMNSLGMNNNNQQNNQNQQDSSSSIPNIDINMIMNIQKAMSAFNKGNKNVDLLRSLKPHFSEDRQKKVDDAIKIMQLLNMLPMLKESGLFGFLGGDKE